MGKLFFFVFMFIQVCGYSQTWNPVILGGVTLKNPDGTYTKKDTINLVQKKRYVCFSKTATTMWFADSKQQRLGDFFEFEKSVVEDHVEKRYYRSRDNALVVATKNRVSYWTGKLNSNGQKLFIHYFYE